MGKEGRPLTAGAGDGAGGGAVGAAEGHREDFHVSSAYKKYRQWSSESEKLRPQLTSVASPLPAARSNTRIVVGFSCSM